MVESNDQPIVKRLFFAFKTLSNDHPLFNGNFSLP